MVAPLLGHRVYLDTSVIIYSTEAPGLFPNLRPLLTEPVARGEILAVTSWITLAEVLVKPLSSGNTKLEHIYRRFLVPPVNFEIVPVDRMISDEAATLRALHGYKLPDAIHVDTGTLAGCTKDLTGDAKWARTGLPVIEAAKLI